MTMRLVFNGLDLHHCDLPRKHSYANGTILECEDCGRQYRLQGRTPDTAHFIGQPGVWNLIAGPSRTPTNGQEPPQ